MLKKHYLAMVAAALLLLLLPGCGTTTGESSSQPEDTEARAQYQAAFDKWNALTHLDVDIQVNVKMAIASAEETILQTTQIKAIRTGDDQIEASVQTVNNGERADSYYKDGYMYIAAAGSRVKKPVEPAMVLQSVGLYKPEYLADLKLTEKDGAKTIEATLTDRALAESIESALGPSAEMMDGLQVQSEKALFTLNEEGYITSAKVNFTFVEQGELGTLTIQIESLTNYQNIGTTFTITPPADLEAYTETQTETTQ